VNVAGEIPNQSYLNEDSKYVMLAQQGQVTAFQVLFERHHKRVFGLVFRLCNDLSYAEDLTQEVFVQVWKKLASFRGDAQFSTWLHTVATRVAISELRKQRSWYQRIRLWGKDEIPTDGPAELPADLSVLDKYVARLPEQTRWVFVLHGLEGLRHEDVSAQLGIAVGTSKTQYHRARKMLEEWLGDAQ